MLQPPKLTLQKTYVYVIYCIAGTFGGKKVCLFTLWHLENKNLAIE